MKTQLQFISTQKARHESTHLVLSSNDPFVSRLHLVLARLEMEKLRLDLMKEAEAVCTEDDELYEEIEAPKFVDFTVPDRFRPDDRSWFCARVGERFLALLQSAKLQSLVDFGCCYASIPESDFVVEGIRLE